MDAVRKAESCDHSCFSTPQGASEFALTFHSNISDNITHSLKKCADAYEMKLDRLGLSDETHVFTRIFCSDIAAQNSALRNSSLFDRLLRSGAVSVVQQPPLNEGFLSMLSYHVMPRPGLPALDCKHKQVQNGWRNEVFTKGTNYGMLWTAGYTGKPSASVGQQTRHIFDSIGETIGSHGMTLLGNAIRTWVFVDGIDSNYRSMVDVRRQFFSEKGLTEHTRYIASTGIEGRPCEPGALVAVDSLSIANITSEQIVRMEAPENLSPTIKYGVTFERGTRVRFGDRSHLYVSGTASIDKEGNVIHEGDPEKQTERTIDNIEALLSPHGASIHDMSYLLVYLREPLNLSSVYKAVKKRIPAHIPILFLKGAICRPIWLVEIEGVGIISDTSEFPPFF